MQFRRIQNAIDLLGTAKPPTDKPVEPTVPAASPRNGEDQTETPALPVLAEIPRIGEQAQSQTPAAHIAAASPPAVVPVRESAAQAPPSPPNGGPPAPVQGVGVPPARAQFVPRSTLFQAVAALTPAPSSAVRREGGINEPKLGIAWGDFHQGVLSSLGALLRGPFGRGPRSEDGQPLTCPYLRDTRVDGRVPFRAVVAAGLWHVAILALPISLFTGLPHRNPALRNVELAWTGPIDDLPLLEIPREKPRTTPRLEAPKLPPLEAEAFHPRQRIFTDPVRPTHPRQTLINPAAPNIAPKFLPNLPNMVQFQMAGPSKPRLQISTAMLKRPRQKRPATTAAPPTQNAPSMQERLTEMDLLPAQSGPARPKLELNASAAPRASERKQPGDTGPAPDVDTTQLTAANGGPQALVALSANPAPPAPVVPPAGNLAARVALSPEGKKGSSGNDAGGSAAGKSSIGVSISGGNPSTSVTGGSGGVRMSAPTPRLLITRPDPKVSEDAEERTAPPDFATLPPGAKPEMIFGSRKVYKLNVNMPNLNSATGSWILNFSEFHTGYRPRTEPTDLSGPVPLKKVDPKYPQTLIAERVEGEVVLYAVIRRDGSVDSIQLVHGIDKELDANAMRALAQWQFRPASRQGLAVELEAIVHIPFRLPEY
jgi:periplasmic protein TonB